MYKSQYTPSEAQEFLKQLDEGPLPTAHKERVRRYVRVRIVEENTAAEN
jgi:hypothetical protein